MAIAEQFAGLKMDKLIGAPLTAAANAGIQLANSTAEFINRVGFDKNGNVRKVAFGYQKRSMNEDGTSNLDEMKVDVPMLAIVPIPNLQVDEVNILFDMEVKQSEKEESSMDLGASITGKVDLGIISVSVTGNVSAHNSNTRSSDNSAKYHVDVRATNHGTPEGLARVLDMMAANVAPALVGSTLKDGDGQDLSAQAKARAERLKMLRAQIAQSERRVAAAQEGFDNSIAMLKDIAMTQLNIYHGIAENANGDEETASAATINEGVQKVDQVWNDFFGRTAALVELVAESITEEEKQTVSAVFGLKAMDKAGNVEVYSRNENAGKYDAILLAQNRAVNAQKNLGAAKQELFERKTAYSDALSGNSTAALPEKSQE